MSSCCCPGYVAQYDPENNEIACAICGAVNADETELARSWTNQEQERESSANHSMPVNNLLIHEMGSQHDMISLKNRGLAMDLGPGSNARDFQGKKCKPILKDAYVTGQVVGKGSQVVFDEDGKLKAKSDYHFDKMYRNAKIEANKRATKLQFGPVEQRFLGKELDKIFCEWGIGLSPKFMAVMALVRMTKYKGLSLELTKEVVKEYYDYVERIRLIVTEFQQSHLIPMQQATR